ncbi:LysR family transcriptional regulator [Anaeromyxobacter sp. Fw109-5]|uniref:LysR family transcriptional regulator n=1 Tax=Anaeromyxobacter sp. (strain Fw109-5) TaxID=404589 RepID=UPI001F2757B8|nr:LysR family transcriptional regulator [Anaeromyxobacter sp. Fw109-5]
MRERMRRGIHPCARGTPVDRLHEMEVFVAVADAGSFAKAGARLRISPPAVTRAVASLERRLGVRLFNRTTRSLRLTEAGLRFLESAKPLLGDLEEAEREAAGDSAAPSGHLTVTTSVTFGRSAMAPVVTEFLRNHPRVTASLMLVDRVVNLVEEGIDVAVRIGQLPDSSLVARRIGEVQRVLVASPEYLAKHGAPASPAELKRHSVIAFTGLMPNREWRFVDGAESSRIAVQPRFEVNDAFAALEAAEAGDGITISPSFIVAERIAAGRLAPVLAAYTAPPVSVQLVHPQSRLVAPKVRAFVEFAGPRLKDVLRRLPTLAARPPARTPTEPRAAETARGGGAGTRG